TGYWHPWFQTARQDPAAQENQFFTFSQHPDHYATWLGVWSLPKLNYASKELRARVFANEDAFFRRWLRPPFSADGWRVDVANMLGRQGVSQMGDQVARSIRQAVKTTRPDAYLIGENFFDATRQLQGDQWDGVMNYMGLTMPLWHWLRGFRQGAWGLKTEISSSLSWPTAALAATWRTRRAAVPWVITLQQFNLLDSHDTARIRSIVAGNAALHRLAAVVQFTFPGVPCIYYGDELGLQDDPHLASRGCMPWDPQGWDHDIRSFYQQLIRLRRSSAALKVGGFQMILEEQDTFAYQRETPTQRVIVIAHRSATPRPPIPLEVRQAGIEDGTSFREYFSGHTLQVQNGLLPLASLPQGAALYVQI
ncbi:MAG: alpha-amylase family glycosyl hydrolase, partial [Anaerolineales bacterium]